MSLIMLAEKRETSPPIFVFRITYFCPPWKRPSSCFQYVLPTTMVVLIRQPSQNIRTFCRRFRSPYVFWSSSSPWWRDSRSGITVCNKHRVWFRITRYHIQVRWWVYSSLYLLSTVLLYRTYCLKKNDVVHQPVFEYSYYCCFHLNPGTTTVGPDIFIRSKKRSLLCAPHPQWSEFKICRSLAANKRQNISAEPVCSSEHSVQNFIRVAYSCRAVFVFIHRQCANDGKTSTYVGVCASLFVVL